jgi:hypothetical protein
VGKAHNFPNRASEDGPLSKAYFATLAKRGSSPLAAPKASKQYYRGLNQ